MKNKFGFLCSSGGSALFAALDILFSENMLTKADVKILADRECGALKTAKEYGIKNEILIQKDNKLFSKKSAAYFKDCDSLLLFFSRLITKELFSILPTFNVHPALLPAFKGFNAIEQCYNSRCKFIGATLHLVNEITDGGEIIGQVLSPISHKSNIAHLYNLSHLQIVYLTLIFVELMLNKIISIDTKKQICIWNKSTKYFFNANPAINDKKLNLRYKEYHQTILGVNYGKF